MENLVGIWSGLFRAVEVAKTGGFSISVYFGGEYKNGFDDYLAIKTFCNGWFDNFVTDGDIKIELFNPVTYEQKKDCETLDDISKRVEKTLLVKKPELKLCTSSEHLLKVAIERLNLSLIQIEKIKAIAITIAQMAFSSIRPEHIAEAIQYSYIYDKKSYNAEGGSKMFGDKIEIKLGKIDETDIKSAIDYLTELLKA